mgnify:CR=1 FL=1
MALSKLKYNSLNVTAAASKAVGFDAGADDLSASISGGSMVFIKKLTASSSGDLSFVDGSASVVFDDTYKEYMFTFKNIHPGTDEAHFQFQTDTGTNTSYNQTITSTNFRAYHNEGGTAQGLGYITGDDQAQGTAFQNLSENDVDGDNDVGLAGTLRIFNPSSSTFVKHFLAETVTIKNSAGGPYNIHAFVAGYFNTTTALTRVRFKFDTGNIDAGDICLYGIS